MTSENDMTGMTVPSSNGSSNSPTNDNGAAGGVPSVIAPTGIIAPPVSQDAVSGPNTAQNDEAPPAEDAVRHERSVGVSETEPIQGRWGADSRVVSALVSTIIHTVALLVLALLSYGAVAVKRSMITLEGRQTEIMPVTALEFMSNDDSELDRLSAEADEPVQVNLSQAATAESIASPMDLALEASPLEESEFASLAAGGSISTDARLQRLPGGGLAGRTREMRIELGKKYGSTRESESAVDLALEWLAAHQRPNGSWSFNLKLDPCNGQCRHGKAEGKESPTPTTGATGLALLAFLGAGHTHHRGDHKRTVRRGLYYLREAGGQTEHGLDWQQGSMYGHGIALMAVAEALSMARADGKYDSDLRALVDRGTYFSVIAQHGNGSWGYVPGSPGDTTLTGWQVMSLLAARRNGAELRTYTLPRAKAYLMSVKEDDEWSFGYKSTNGEPTMDAIALTLLLYLGQTPGFTPFDRALDRIADRGPTLTNVYHDYYATLALHHARHRDWDRWNSKLRDHLVAAQATKGHERGSWHFKDKWGDVGGRVYTTAMCAMILEVYYRYLPLYEEIEDFPL